MWLTKWIRTTPDTCVITQHANYDCHVVPVADTRDHAMTEKCWCEPVRDDEPPHAWIHNSADRREEFETQRRLPS